MAPSIVVVTGASGAGKTAAVSALAALDLPGVRCFHFDSIGVPSADAMEQDYGGGDAWQAWATRQWLARLRALDDGTRVAVLDGQTRPAMVFDAVPAGSDAAVRVILFHCEPDVRAARLRGLRGQPELVNARMDTWAAYLRDQAVTLDLPIVDTTALGIDEAVERLRALL